MHTICPRVASAHETPSRRQKTSKSNRFCIELLCAVANHGGKSCFKPARPFATRGHLFDIALLCSRKAMGSRFARSFSLSLFFFSFRYLLACLHDLAVPLLLACLLGVWGQNPPPEGQPYNGSRLSNPLFGACSSVPSR